MEKSPSSPDEKARLARDRLVHALWALDHDVEKLPREFEYVINPGKHLWITYLRGIVYALGALTAVVLVVPLLIWVLHGIQWVPIVGDFVTAITNRVEQSQNR